MREADVDHVGNDSDVSHLEVVQVSLGVERRGNECDGGRDQRAESVHTECVGIEGAVEC